MRARSDVVELRPPLPVMTAVPVAEPPDGPGGRWAYEPKLDGFRVLAFRGPHGRVRLQSRQQRDLTRYFPEVANAIAEQFDGHVVLDGELVVALDGRCDFAALQRRLRRNGARNSEPGACLVAFDLLAVAGMDVRALPYRQRRRRLVDLITEARPPLSLTPMTLDRDAAGTWLVDHAAAGVEGVVAKRTEHTYRPTRPTSWCKIRARTTEEVIVVGSSVRSTLPPR